MKKRKSAKPSHRPPPNENEEAMVVLLTHSFLRQCQESFSGQPSTIPGFEAVVPHYWLTQARAAVVLAAKQRREAPESGNDLVDLARGWLHRALRASFDADTLRAAASILGELADMELLTDKEEVETHEVVERWLEEATTYLTNAAQQAPSRPDILSELARALASRACLIGSNKTSLLHEALRRSDEAVACYTETSRRVAATGSLHPAYVLCLTQGGSIRWLLATGMEDDVEKRELLTEACRLMRQAVVEGSMDEPSGLQIFGEITLNLGWLPASSQARRDLFVEACEQFAAVMAGDPRNSRACACRASALVGLAALSSGGEARNFLRKAEELFAKQVRLLPGESEPFLDAAYDWLRLAAEPASEAAIEGAPRAVEAARKANSLTPGSGDYCLACGLSRLGQIAEATESLTAALASDPTQVTEALRDPHLEAVWVSKPEWRRDLAASKINP